VDSTETDSTQEGRGAGSGDNVVRLPRDWLGPREELVPLRPPAEQEPPTPQTEPPISAYGFWDGEDLAAVNAGFAETAGPAQPHRRGIRTRRALAATVAAVLLTLGVAVALGGGRATSRPATRSARPSAQVPSTAQLTAIRPAIEALERMARAAVPAASPRSHRSPAPARHRGEPQPVRQRRRSRHLVARASAEPPPVHHTATGSPASPASHATASRLAVAASASTAIGGAGGSASSPRSGDSAGGSAAVSQPAATGANGTLSPGSSPDS
jgi:hypothetical protein